MDRDLFLNREVHAVSIATPPNTHYEIGMQALQAGKHVILEKPPTLTLEQLEEMESEALNHGVVLFTAFHTRYRDEVYAARDYLIGKQVKEIEIRRYQHVKTYHPNAFTNGWILNKAIAGGGIVIDDGTNFIASTGCALSDNVSFGVTGAKIIIPDGMEVETQADIDFNFDKSGRGNMKMDWLHEGQEVATITLKTGQEECVIDLLTAEFLVNGKPLTQGTCGESRVDISGEYRRVYEHFQHCILEGKSFVSKGELEFVLRVYELAGRK